mmetsp:Transcript_19993/g.65128  ORF Transcript_19993/g.65128 Transcript_19993/m.65128 type:complete len:291 (+) Transcript_19993:93-965(+)
MNGVCLGMEASVDCPSIVQTSLERPAVSEPDGCLTTRDDVCPERRLHVEAERELVRLLRLDLARPRDVPGLGVVRRRRSCSSGGSRRDEVDFGGARVRFVAWLLLLHERDLVEHAHLDRLGLGGDDGVLARDGDAAEAGDVALDRLYDAVGGGADADVSVLPSLELERRIGAARHVPDVRLRRHHLPVHAHAREPGQERIARGVHRAEREEGVDRRPRTHDVEHLDWEAEAGHRHRHLGLHPRRERDGGADFEAVPDHARLNLGIDLPEPREELLLRLLRRYRLSRLRLV